MSLPSVSVAINLMLGLCLPLLQCITVLNGLKLHAVILEANPFPHDDAVPRHPYTGLILAGKGCMDLLMGARNIVNRTAHSVQCIMGENLLECCLLASARPPPIYPPPTKSTALPLGQLFYISTVSAL